MALRDERRNGLDGIVLESNEVSLSVFPAAGGKIIDLIHRPSGRNLLWHNPRIGLAATNPGASFDDVWCGGWDEIFPTDPPCADATNSYHDHGDLWIGPWSATPDGENALVLERASASLPCVMTKRLEVVGDAVHVSYRLVNTGYAAFDYMWDIHMAHAIRPGSRIEVPGSPEWFPEEPFPGRTGQSGADLMTTPEPEGAFTEWLWSQPDDGLVAVRHPDGSGISIAYDTAAFPYLWLWGVYGGWRGHYVLLTEPCTSRPGSLVENVDRGTAARMNAGQALETEVTIRVAGRQG